MVSKFEGFNLPLHEKQAEVFHSNSKFKVLVCGRRWGKSRLQITKLLYKALTFEGTVDPTVPQTIVGVLPTLKQAKKILWAPLVNLLKGCPIVRDINQSDFTIRWVRDRYPRIVIAGANDQNGDRLRGLRILHIGADEIQDWKPDIFDSVIVPAMADTEGSSALLTGTPKGKLNHLYGLFNRQSFDPDWQSFNYATITNPFVDKTEVEKRRLILSPRLFEQEYYASFTNFEGQIFSEFDPIKHIVNCDNKNLTDYWIGHDCGDINPAIVVVGKNTLGEFFIIESNRLGDQKTPVPLSTVYALIEKWAKLYNANRIYVDPSRPLVIKDIREIGIEKNIHGLETTVAAYNKIEEGNDLINNYFWANKLYVSDKIKELPDKIASYHRKIDRDGNITDKVAENQDDHELDALRYILASLAKRR
jgi:hypothetical protein